MAAFITLSRMYNSEVCFKGFISCFFRFVLRRSILQEAIEKAEKGDYRMVNILLQMIEDPFTDKPGQRGTYLKYPSPRVFVHLPSKERGGGERKLIIEI